MKNKNLKMYFIVFFIAAFLVAFGLKTQSMIAAPSKQDRLVPPTQPSAYPTSPSYEPSAATFLGEYVCLPHKDTKGPQTMECAYGLKLQDDTYIALDLSAVTPTPNYRTGSKLFVSGLYVPIQRLSSDHWQKYNINGILQVKEVVKK